MLHSNNKHILYFCNLHTFLYLFLLQGNVVCKQLGFPSANEVLWLSPMGPVQSNFSYDDVMCAGTEATLDACPHANYHDCNANEGVWIVCNLTSG